MRAVTYEKYGAPDVLEVKEVPTPRPGDDEVLVEIRATTVTSGDARLRALDVPPGFKIFSRLAFGVVAPRQHILGSEASGVVAAVGRNVRSFAVGDEVVAMSGGFGCHAEFRAFAADGPVVKKPPNLSFEEAASLGFGGTTALAFFEKAGIESGERVLVNGASGAVGTAAVQLAKHFGAHVTGVCSGPNVELVRSLGADEVIDYTLEDFTARGETWDIIIDTAGTAPYARSKGVLREGGRLLQVLGGMRDLVRAPLVGLTSDKRVIAGPVSARAEDLRAIAELAEAGTLKPVIDRVYPLEKTAEAHAYVDTKHKKGSVVISVKGDAPPS